MIEVPPKHIFRIHPLTTASFQLFYHHNDASSICWWFQFSAIESQSEPAVNFNISKSIRLHNQQLGFVHFSVRINYRLIGVMDYGRWTERKSRTDESKSLWEFHFNDPHIRSDQSEVSRDPNWSARGVWLYAGKKRLEKYLWSAKGESLPVHHFSIYSVHLNGFFLCFDIKTV